MYYFDVPRLALSDREVERVRRDAVRAAKELFRQGGAEALSLRSVAAETGFSTGGLYRYFPGGRDEILAAVRLDALVLLDRLLWEAIEKAHDPIEGLTLLADALFQFATGHSTEYELLCVYTEGDWELLPELAERNEALWKPLESVLEQGVVAGVFEGNPRVLARSFYAAMMGALTIFLSDEDDPLLSIEPLRKSLFGLLIRGATPLAHLIEREGPSTRAANGCGQEKLL